MRLRTSAGQKYRQFPQTLGITSFIVYIWPIKNQVTDYKLSATNALQYSISYALTRLLIIYSLGVNS